MRRDGRGEDEVDGYAAERSFNACPGISGLPQRTCSHPERFQRFHRQRDVLLWHQRGEQRSQVVRGHKSYEKRRSGSAGSKREKRGKQERKVGVG